MMLLTEELHFLVVLTERGLDEAINNFPDTPHGRQVMDRAVEAIDALRRYRQARRHA